MQTSIATAYENFRQKINENNGNNEFTWSNTYEYQLQQLAREVKKYQSRWSFRQSQEGTLVSADTTYIKIKSA